MGAALSRADLSAAASRGVSCWNCSGRKQSSPPFNWQLGCSVALLPLSSAVFPQPVNICPGALTSEWRGRQALLGALVGGVGWGGATLPHLGLWMVEGQAQVAFLIQKRPRKEWYF